MTDGSPSCSCQNWQNYQCQEGPVLCSFCKWLSLSFELLYIARMGASYLLLGKIVKCFHLYRSWQILLRRLDWLVTQMWWSVRGELCSDTVSLMWLVLFSDIFFIVLEILNFPMKDVIMSHLKPVCDNLYIFICIYSHVLAQIQRDTMNVHWVKKKKLPRIFHRFAFDLWLFHIILF